MASRVIGGRLYDPQHCVESDDPNVEHRCIHDWRIYWQNFDREYIEPMG